MIAMTTNSSTRVKPDKGVGRESFTIHLDFNKSDRIKKTTQAQRSEQSPNQHNIFRTVERAFSHEKLLCSTKLWDPFQ